MTAYTKATNFLAKDSLPDTDAGKIIKGSEFDTEFNNLQTAVNSKANSLSAALSGTPTAPTATAGTNTTQIATTAFVTTAVNNGFPSGGIIIWSGSSAAIPSGWYLCDGNNSTPDLRNRFVVGATDTYNVGDTGGSKDAIVVSHTHTGTTVGAGSHNHSYLRSASTGANQYSDHGGSDTPLGRESSTTGSVGDHTHTFTTNSTGSSGTNANLPPYYALCYIMKS
jgi:hypothetical protein